jgi:transcriptional regulator with XRE-family HTH domain
MDIRRTLAANVVRLRRTKGLSQEALGWEAGVSRSYMARIEGGRTSTGVDILAKFAAVLEVEPWELLRPLPPPKRGRKPAAGGAGRISEP